LKALQAENAALRAQLGLNEPMTDEIWGVLPQDVRDSMAVRVMFEEYGHTGAALKRLGFKVPSGQGSRDERAALVQRVFGTPGVKALLEKDLADAEANRQGVIARTTQIALHGKDDSSVRATQMLAKLAGWTKDEAPPPQNNIHLYAIVGGARVPEGEKRITTIEHAAIPGATADALSLLAHEPGAARRVDLDETPDVRKAVEQSEAFDLNDGATLE
jgi:hypothetical protein